MRTTRVNVERWGEEGGKPLFYWHVVGAAVVASRNAPCPPLYPLVRKSGVPVLLAHATEPRELQPLRRVAIERFRTALPQARLVPIPNATHSVLQDNGPGVIRVLLAWLDELG